MASRIVRSRISTLLSAAVLNHRNTISPSIISVPSSSTFLRCLNSSPGRYRSSPGRRPVDIGARARQLQNRRLWTYALTFSGIAGFIVIVLANFQDQLVFYITPSDAIAKYRANPSKTRFRLGGLVMEGSVAYPTTSSPEMEFVVTDLLTDIIVRYEGSLPDLFREGHSVVVEGVIRPFSADTKVHAVSATRLVTEKARSLDCYFWASEVLAKHDEKYMPKEVAEALEKNKKKLEEDAQAKASALESTS
ncbi:hypothetical protein HPP92_017841 [Vanilla planifolia]|uniref:Uncharacterized protein n=1 Tax=Vanilla planifolia TaxID=51239 RepID=A0A835Q8T0_VANPL|nr:hypothetical protein HPP92_017841 [Vanilla planifolia]